MIIKSHIRGGYRSAAEYMKDQGKNEKTRLVEISDPEAKNLDEAFQKMWEVAGNTRCTKPLHHISINPMKDERLTDKQVLAIVARCEEKYGYKMFHHQRVIVEHIKDGRQHFHVIWNRVSLMTGRPVWPGHHWKKSKQVCREMEKELGLKCPTPKRMQKAHIKVAKSGRIQKTAARYDGPNKPIVTPTPIRAPAHIKPLKEEPSSAPTPPMAAKGSKGWPEAAITDWETWGHRNPPRFFALWPELS